MIKSLGQLLASRNIYIKQSSNIKNKSLFSTENQRKKDSKWIYSSKYDEMQSMHKGRIYVTTDTGNNCHDVTLRMYNALINQSSVVFSYDPKQTQMLLQSLASKQKYIDPSLHKDSQQQTKIEQTSQIISRQNKEGHLTKLNIAEQQQKTFQQTIELGKFVDMEVDMQNIMKSNNDPGNKNLFQRQKEIKKYLKNRQFRTQLQNLKKKQGYPQVQSIVNDKEDINYFYQNGINVTYVLHEFQIAQSSKVLRALQELSIPYEILPCKNQLINAIVASGFPADRFSIQYFPENLQQILVRRKKSKLTSAIIIKKEFLQNTIQTISTIYGKDHFIFVQNSSNSFRSQIHNFYDYLKENPLSQHQKYVKIIVSPFISQFNQTLLQQQHKVRHIFGEAQSERTNFIELQILGEKLQQLKKKQYTHQVDLFNMTAQMIQRIKNPQIVKSSLRKMLSLNETQVNYYFEQGQKRIRTDYLGISEFENYMKNK